MPEKVFTVQYRLAGMAVVLMRQVTLIGIIAGCLPDKRPGGKRLTTQRS